VLFNEPKLLKFTLGARMLGRIVSFSALQRAEIAEMLEPRTLGVGGALFQCSSTSRNC